MLIDITTVQEIQYCCTFKDWLGVHIQSTSEFEGMVHYMGNMSIDMHSPM